MTAFSVLAGPHVVLLVPWSGPTHAAATLSVASVDVDRVQVADAHGEHLRLRLAVVTPWLSGANRFGPFGASAPGIVYVVPMPGVSPGLASGLIRSSLPSNAFVLPEVWRASA